MSRNDGFAYFFVVQVASKTLSTFAKPNGPFAVYVSFLHTLKVSVNN